MNILGLQKLTLLDYPGRLAAILFLGGCNFRCPFCQNSALVLAPDTLPVISREELRKFLKKRAGILEGICITGGEPTLHADLPDLIREIRAEGYPVKLDTNGTNPELLSSLIADGLLDYVAMDIKAGRSNYRSVCGLNPAAPDSRAQSAPASGKKERCLPADQEPPSEKRELSILPDQDPLLEKVQRSADLLMHSSVDYEFRTTVVRGLHTAEDFEDIGRWLRGCRRYFLQSFQDCPQVLRQGHAFSAFSPEEMQDFLKLVQKEIPQADLRGI